MANVEPASRVLATHDQTATIDELFAIINLRVAEIESTSPNCLPQWRTRSFKYIDTNNLLNHSAKWMKNETIL